MSRIIIFTGKGGVGKTSTAAAHAVKAAEQGMKTLIVSTDMAHNLSDIFTKEIKEEPVEVTKNLDALEIDSNHEMDRYYGSISKAIRNMMPVKDEQNEETMEDIVVFPGIEELFSLLKIQEMYDKRIYDLIIVDCAPTGETLSLLKFPELFSWYMEKFFPIGKVAMKVLRPVSKVAFKIDMPNAEAMNDIEKLYVKLEMLQQLLKDREVCSIRLVALPEKMVVEESKRSYMYLNLYNFNVDGVYINRIIPDNVDNDFFNHWKDIQRKYLEELTSVFTELPIYKIKWYDTDINGIQGLERIIQDSLGDDNIFTVQRNENSEVFEKTDKGYKLQLRVPFTDKEGFDLFEAGTDAVVKLGNFKRNIPIPNVMRKYSITSAKLKDGMLNIYFE